MERKNSQYKTRTIIGGFVDPVLTLSGDKEQKIKEGLLLLPFKARMLFALDCAEKALPVYENYAKGTRLRRILELTRDQVITEEVPVLDSDIVDEVTRIQRSEGPYQGELKRRAWQAVKSAQQAVTLYSDWSAHHPSMAAWYAIEAVQESSHEGADWVLKILNRYLRQALDEAMQNSDLPPLEGDDSDITQATIIRDQAYQKLKEIMLRFPRMSALEKKKSQWVANQFQEVTSAYDWLEFSRIFVRSLGRLGDKSTSLMEALCCHRFKSVDDILTKWEVLSIPGSRAKKPKKKDTIGGKMTRASEDTLTFQTYARDRSAKNNSTLYKRKKDLGAFLQYPEWVRIYPDGHLEVVYKGYGAKEEVWATYRDKAHINRTFDMKFDRDYVKQDGQATVGAKQPGTKNLDKTPLNHGVIDGPLARLIHTLSPLQILLNKFSAKWEFEQEAYIDGARDSWDQISDITFKAFPRIKTQTKILIDPIFSMVFDLLDVMTFDGVGKSAIEKERKAWVWFQTKLFGQGPSYAGAYASHCKDLNTEIAFAQNLLVKPDANYRQLFQFLEQLRSTLSMLYSSRPVDEVGKTENKIRVAGKLPALLPSKAQVGAISLKKRLINHSVVDGPLAQVLVPLRKLDDYLGKINDFFFDETSKPEYKSLYGNRNWDGASNQTFKKFPGMINNIKLLVDEFLTQMFPLLNVLEFEGVGKKICKDLTKEYVFFRDKFIGIKANYAGKVANTKSEIAEYLRLGEVLLRDPNATYENLYAWIGNIRFPLAQIYYRPEPNNTIGWADPMEKGDGDGGGDGTGKKIKKLLAYLPPRMQIKWANDCLHHILPEFEKAFPRRDNLRKIISLRRDLEEGKVTLQTVMMASPTLFPYPEDSQGVLYAFFAAAMSIDPYEISKRAAEAVMEAQQLGYAFELERQWQLRRLQEYDSGVIAGKASVGAARKLPAKPWPGVPPKLHQRVRTACPAHEEGTVCRNWNARLPETGVVSWVSLNKLHLEGVVRPFTRRDNGAWVLEGYDVKSGPFLEPLSDKTKISGRTQTFTLGALPRDMREELFNLHATSVNPEATERKFSLLKVPTGTLDISKIRVTLLPKDLVRYSVPDFSIFPPIVIADGKLIDGAHRVASAQMKGVTHLKFIDMSGLLDPDSTGYICELS